MPHYTSEINLEKLKKMWGYYFHLLSAFLKYDNAAMKPLNN